jgi:hypothetical protein
MKKKHVPLLELLLIAASIALAPYPAPAQNRAAAAAPE